MTGGLHQIPFEQLKSAREIQYLEPTEAVTCVRAVFFKINCLERSLSHLAERE
jgi:hypothetical protein